MEMTATMPSIAAAVMIAANRNRAVPHSIFFILSPSVSQTNFEI
jgi:hypothetical protein